MRENIERLKDWILKADHDLGTALVVQKYIPGYSDTIAFHCQQASEKYLKCLLEYHSISFKKSHDLRYLLDLLDNVIPISASQYEKAMKLNGFCVEIRYPEIIIELSSDDKFEAIEIAKDFREFVKRNIDFKIDENELPDFSKS
jgi:HEPN domain-containing protein